MPDAWRETNKTLIPISLRTNATAFAAPPVPKISAQSCLLVKNGLMLCLKPKASVLYPILLLFLNTIVFTAPISFAIGSISSKKGRILSL